MCLVRHNASRCCFKHGTTRNKQGSATLNAFQIQQLSEEHAKTEALQPAHQKSSNDNPILNTVFKKMPIWPPTADAGQLYLFGKW
jgi:hypothetical protein